MSYIGNEPAVGQWRKLTDISSSFDGVTTTFTTSVPPGTSAYYVTAGSASQLIISLGGVIQEPDVDYTVNTNTITFTTAPASGLSFFGVLCGDALNVGTPGDGSVTTSKLGTNLSVDLTSGSAATPSLTFDANTGLYSPGEDQVAISTGGTGRLFVDSSGRVGLGTSSPSNLLHVSGTGSTPAVFERTGSNGCFIGLKDNSGNLSYLGTTNGVFSIQTPGSSYSDKLVVTSAGLVGIGTTSVTGKLSIDGSSLNPISSLNTASNYAVALYGGSATGNGNGIAFCNDNGTSVGGAIIHIDQGSNNVGDLAFYTAATANSPTERARIDSSGRLLVGTSTTSKQTRALVQGNSGGGTTAEVIMAADTSSPAGGVGNIYFSDNSHNTAAIIAAVRDGGTWTSGSSHPISLQFYTTADGASNPTERMRINKDGYVAYFGNGTRIGHTSAAGTTEALIQGGHSASNIANMTTSFYVWTNGNVVNTNNSYGAISDVKLKENIVDASSQWDDLKALQVRNYNFKEGQTHTQIGLIAQEVELVSPGLVSESPDRDKDGNDLGTVTKSVNYSVLYMKAVKALQEAIERIETLEQRLDDAGIA